MTDPLEVKMVLALEREWADRPALDGRKEQAIRDRFGVGPISYYQRLNAILDTVEALELDPVLTRRLQRIRAAGQRSRSARRGVS